MYALTMNYDLSLLCIYIFVLAQIVPIVRRNCCSWVCAGMIICHHQESPADNAGT